LKFRCSESDFTQPDTQFCVTTCYNAQPRVVCMGWLSWVKVSLCRVSANELLWKLKYILVFWLRAWYSHEDESILVERGEYCRCYKSSNSCRAMALGPACAV